MKRVGVVVLLLAIAAGLFLFLRPEPTLSPDASTHDGGSASTSAAARSSSGNDHERESKSELSASSATRRAASKLYPVNANSDADARWMSARFYPSQEEIDQVNAMTSVELPDDLVPNSISDLLIAQRALRDPSRVEDAKVVLENGAIRGATFALIALGQTLEPISPIDSQAYFRAAVSLGDWSPALRYAPNMDHASDVLATLRALEILERIDSARLARGLPRLTREVRPGLPMVMESVAANSRILNPRLPGGEGEESGR